MAQRLNGLIGLVDPQQSDALRDLFVIPAESDGMLAGDEATWTCLKSPDSDDEFDFYAISWDLDRRSKVVHMVWDL